MVPDSDPPDGTGRWRRAVFAGRLVAMPITVQHEGANIYRLDVSGRLGKPEFDRGQESLAAEIRRIGPVRLLFVLSQFEGWEQNPNWGDLSFYVTHGDSIDRIAIVGDEKWRNETMMFASRLNRHVCVVRAVDDQRRHADSL